MPFGQAASAALAAQYYEDAIYHCELYMAKQEARDCTAAEPAPADPELDQEEGEDADSALFAGAIYPGSAAELGKHLSEAFNVSGGDVGLNTTTLDNCTEINSTLFSDAAFNIHNDLDIELEDPMPRIEKGQPLPVAQRTGWFLTFSGAITFL
eukprot:3124240-Rhodomonas_salina.1